MDPFPALFHHIIHARPMTRRFQLPKFLSAPLFRHFWGAFIFAPPLYPSAPFYTEHPLTISSTALFLLSLIHP
jgi:hypothetical protein